MIQVDMSLSRAFQNKKLFHCMREHPERNFGPLKRDFLLGKIQNEGQLAGNTDILVNGSSETMCETFILKDKNFQD
jgi:hypothetical protein